MPNVDHGTAAVLLVDLVAATTAAVLATLYLHLDLGFLVVFAAITFGLAFAISILLRQSNGVRRPAMR